MRHVAALALALPLLGLGCDRCASRADVDAAGAAAVDAGSVSRAASPAADPAAPPAALCVPLAKAVAHQLVAPATTEESCPPAVAGAAIGSGMERVELAKTVTRMARVAGDKRQCCYGSRAPGAAGD